MQVLVFQFTSYADLYNVPLRIILIYIMYVSGFMTYIIITPHVLPQKKRNKKIKKIGNKQTTTNTRFTTCFGVVMGVHDKMTLVDNHFMFNMQNVLLITE